MRYLILSLFLFFSSDLIHGQYYYKDILVADQTAKVIGQHKAAKIKSVTVSSFEPNGQQIEDFRVDQSYNSNYTEMVTNTNSVVASESQLKTVFDNAGRIVRSSDTTDGFSSITRYQYTNEGRLTSMSNVSLSAGQSRDTEQHLWYYNQAGKPVQMIKIKNEVDTSVFKFVLDENGNVAEEIGTRKGNTLPTVYYYYDAANRLTDIVRYNQKARRLLPDYVFEYSDQGQLQSMMVVPEGSDDYERYLYQYDDSGLKVKETVMNKRRQIIGRLEYKYGR